MTDPAMVPCRIIWCDMAEHPAGDVLRHSTTAFEAGDTRLRIVWAERPAYKGQMTPVIKVEAPGLHAVDMVYPEALVWIRLLEQLDTNGLAELVAALISTAHAIEGHGVGIEDGEEFVVVDPSEREGDTL